MPVYLAPTDKDHRDEMGARTTSRSIPARECYHILEGMIGRHAKKCRARLTAVKVQFTGGPVYCLAILGFKVSLLASYHRLAGFNRNYRIVINTVMALVVANQVIYTFLLSFGCRPVRLFPHVRRATV